MPDFHEWQIIEVSVEDIWVDLTQLVVRLEFAAVLEHVLDLAILVDSVDTVHKEDEHEE